MNDAAPVTAAVPEGRPEEPPARPAPRPAVTPGDMARDMARDTARDAVHARALIGAFRRRLWAFLAVLFIVPASAWVAIQRTTPLYTATGALIYEPSEYKARELQSILRSDPITDSVLASQAEILRSLKIAQRVADRGRLHDNPEFNVALRPPSRLARLLRDTGFARLLHDLGLAPGPPVASVSDPGAGTAAGPGPAPGLPTWDR